MASASDSGTDLDSDLDSAADREEPSALEESAGDELFDDVVESRPDPNGAGSHHDPAAPDGGDVQLHDCVAGLYDMVKDLEVQLNHMISINEAAERDLEASRRARRELEKERDGLRRRIERMERDAQSSAELREELRYMAAENERLMEQMRGEDAKAERWEQEREQAAAKLAFSEAECTDLREEVECLEQQITQAGEYIDGLRTTVGQMREASEQQGRRAELTEQRLHVVTEERDALRRELNESKSALEEIKRSIMDTNIQSQMSYYGS